MQAMQGNLDADAMYAPNRSVSERPERPGQTQSATELISFYEEGGKPKATAPVAPESVLRVLCTSPHHAMANATVANQFSMARRALMARVAAARLRTAMRSDGVAALFQARRVVGTTIVRIPIVFPRPSAHLVSRLASQRVS